MKAMMMLVLAHATLSWVNAGQTVLFDKKKQPSFCDSECEVSCTIPPGPDCEQWGDCSPWDFCMPKLDGCPPPPAYCDWETQTSCYVPAPHDCERGCWGEEFCASHEEGCPPVPIQCYEDEIVCSDGEWEYCMWAQDGCPPPPVECNWDTETSCWEPSPQDCEVGCWGTEFCASHEAGCPPWPMECYHDEILCSHPAPPGCEEWGPGGCNPMEFCMWNEDGCPPPPVNCDWDAGQNLCYSPPHPDCTGPNCWGSEFCIGGKDSNVTECPMEPSYLCGSDELVCSDPPAPDCAEWGDCEPYEFCMNRVEGCPPPPVNCDWETENACWTPPPQDCMEGCWGHEFCVLHEDGCPMPPLECWQGETHCTMPPWPDCADWGDCNPQEFCLPMEYEHMGCPPPPVFCDWDGGEDWCHTPPADDCEGTACWGVEFCMPMDQGCPPPPLQCYDDQIHCTHPPSPDCEEWGDCNPQQFCMPKCDGCPPPMVYCDWETQTVCHTPPPEDCEFGCWGQEFCAPLETGCPTAEGMPGGGKDDDGWFGLTQRKMSKKKKLRGKKLSKKNGQSAAFRSMVWHEQIGRTHIFANHTSKEIAKRVREAPKTKAKKLTGKDEKKARQNFRRILINEKRMINSAKHTAKAREQKKTTHHKAKRGLPKGISKYIGIERRMMALTKRNRKSNKQHKHALVRRTK